MANSASDCDVSLHKIMSRNDCSARSANDVPLVYIASQETSTKLVNQSIAILIMKRSYNPTLYLKQLAQTTRSLHAIFHQSSLVDMTSVELKTSESRLSWTQISCHNATWIVSNSFGYCNLGICSVPCWYCLLQSSSTIKKASPIFLFGNPWCRTTLLCTTSVILFTNIITSYCRHSVALVKLRMSQNPKHASIFLPGTMAVISHNAPFSTMLMVKLTHLGREFSSSTNLTFVSWRVRCWRNMVQLWDSKSLGLNSSLVPGSQDTGFASWPYGAVCV